MKRRFLIPLIAWEAIVLGYVAVVMIVFGKTLNAENERKLAIIAVFGIVVVLLCWPVCRLLPRTAGWIAGCVIGLLTPPLLVWTIGWLRPQVLSMETGILGMVLSVPSGLGGLVAGGLQARSRRAAVTNAS